MVGEELISVLFLEQMLGELWGVILLLHDLGENMDSSILLVICLCLSVSGWDILSVVLNYDILDAAVFAIVEEADVIVVDEVFVLEVFF